MLREAREKKNKVENIGIFENIVGILVKNSRIFDPLGEYFFLRPEYIGIFRQKRPIWGIFTPVWQNMLSEYLTYFGRILCPRLVFAQSLNFFNKKGKHRHNITTSYTSTFFTLIKMTISN